MLPVAAHKQSMHVEYTQWDTLVWYVAETCCHIFLTRLTRSLRVVGFQFVWAIKMHRSCRLPIGQPGCKGHCLLSNCASVAPNSHLLRLCLLFAAFTFHAQAPAPPTARIPVLIVPAAAVSPPVAALLVCQVAIGGWTPARQANTE